MVGKTIRERGLRPGLGEKHTRQQGSFNGEFEGDEDDNRTQGL